MKKIFTLFLLQIVALSTWAQIGFNYHEYSAELGIGMVTPSTGPAKGKGKAAFNTGFTYHHTPFVNFGLQYQMGNLAAGDFKANSIGFLFNNSFSAFILNGNIQAGELIDYSRNPILNGVKNLYVGSGIGFIFNNITTINRTIPDYPDVFFNGDDKSSNLMLPLKVGYEFKLFNEFDEPQVRIDLAYQNNIVFGKGLSGYDISSSPNRYSYISVTLKYGIGSITSYRKPIKY